MELGMIGLGRMGRDMAVRIIQSGHSVVGFDSNSQAVQDAIDCGIIGTSSLEELVGNLRPPRVLWLMVPAGNVVESVIRSVSELLSPDDTILNGGNCHYKDSIRWSEELQQRDLHYIDVGTSGGVWGLRDGYSLMIGGPEKEFKRLEPIFQALAPGKDRGYGRVGPTGAGHFVKMVHNGIEYGLMQAYAEGFELMESKKDMELDLYRIAEIWRSGSVISSRLLDFASLALRRDSKMEDVAPYIEDTGEGRWTLMEAVELGVPVPVLSLALQARFRSRQDRPFGARLLAALRGVFGGHDVPKI